MHTGIRSRGAFVQNALTRAFERNYAVRQIADRPKRALLLLLSHNRDPLRQFPGQPIKDQYFIIRRYNRIPIVALGEGARFNPGGESDLIRQLWRIARQSGDKQGNHH